MTRSTVEDTGVFRRLREDSDYYEAVRCHLSVTFVSAEATGASGGLVSVERIEALGEAVAVLGRRLRPSGGPSEVSVVEAIPNDDRGMRLLADPQKYDVRLAHLENVDRPVDFSYTDEAYISNKPTAIPVASVGLEVEHDL